MKTRAAAMDLWLPCASARRAPPCPPRLCG